MNTNNTTMIEQLKAAIKNLEEMKTDTYSMAVEFDKKKINTSGSYVAITVDPTGSWSVGASPSWECSANEYFSESGVLSLSTIHSESGCFGTPGPEDGYEWEDSEDGKYWGNDSGSWCCEDDLESYLEEHHSEEYESADDEADLEVIAMSVGLHRFTVSDRACESDGYYELAKVLEDRIDEIIKDIQNEIDRREEEENTTDEDREAATQKAADDERAWMDSRMGT